VHAHDLLTFWGGTQSSPQSTFSLAELASLDSKATWRLLLVLARQGRSVIADQMVARDGPFATPILFGIHSPVLPLDDHCLVAWSVGNFVCSKVGFSVVQWPWCSCFLDCLFALLLRNETG